MITPQELRELIEYDPATGAMLWRQRDEHHMPDLRARASWNARYAGKPVSSYRNEWGYNVFSVGSRKFQAHRVAWAIHYGEWPEDQIDHINRDPADNRIDNLRSVSLAENLRNKGSYRNNTSGYKGVTWHKSSGKWMAQLKVSGRNIHLGLFDDPAEAHAAYTRRVEQEFGASNA